jgi:2,4-dienoyl-CoA reductase-like NADH-dependent reductase (Old Yellow Enzyme family)
MQTPRGVAWGTNLPYDRQVAYYTERAKGGAALVCIGVSVVHRSGASGDPFRPATVAEPAQGKEVLRFSPVPGRATVGE